jgi:hypothetical protein
MGIEGDHARGEVSFTSDGYDVAEQGLVPPVDSVKDRRR